MPLAFSHVGEITRPYEDWTRGRHHKRHMTLNVFMIGLIVMKKLYKKHMQWVLDVVGDDMQVEYHRHCTLRCYLMFVGGTSMFMEKSETYINVVYLKHFFDLTLNHEYNLGGACLVYLYSKLGESYHGR